MGDHEPRLPPTGVAFEDTATHAAWKAARRLVRLKLSLWSALFVGAFTLSAVFADVRWGDAGARGDNSVGGAIGGVAFLAYPFALYACCGALSRLRKARSILQAYPWRSVPAVRKLPDTKEALGVPVQLRLPEGEEPGGPESAFVDDDGSVWSQSMSARNPLRWNRWDEAMERGAWFAGDFELGGVLALPGGKAIMTVRRRTQVLSMGAHSAKGDHASILAAAPGRR